MAKSLAQRVAEMSDEERAAIFADFTEEDWEALQWDWQFWARPEQLVPEGTFIHLALAGRGWGKLLPLNTPVPTPRGWKTMGEIQDGDAIFDEQGRITYVIKAHDIEKPKKAYRLHFSDGTYIDSGEEHQWVTWTHADRKSLNRTDSPRQKIINDPTLGYPEDWPNWTRYNRWGTSTGVGPKVRTTQEIVDTFTYGKRGDLNHSIPVARALELPAKKYTLAPYLLGAWLGDGHTNSGVFTQHTDDKYVIEEALTASGIEFSSVKETSKENTWRIGTKRMTATLAELKVLGRKHIPQAYLRGSVEQRKNLLAGLLDTDGTIDRESGKVEFCTTLPELAQGVMELLRSLGEKPVLHQSPSYLYGVRKKDRYRITFRPKFNPFRIERKRALFQPLGSQAMRNYHRMIVSYEEIEPVYMRCLTVDSPNSMYLVGEGMIPTHNTRAGAEFVRDRAMRYPGCRIALVGRASGDTTGTIIYGESGIMSISPESERPHHKISQRKLIWPNGSTAETFSSQEPSQLRGPQFHFALADELGSWLHTKDDSGLNAWANLKIATRLEYMKDGKRSDPQIFVATTPKRTDTITEILDRYEERPGSVSIARGTTYDNVANLSAMQLEELTDMYDANSDIGRQELLGEMLGDNEGIVWTQKVIDDHRLLGVEQPNLPLRVVAVDPSVSENPTDECGIVVLGATNHRLLHKRTAVVLEDASIKASPKVWAKVVADLAVKYNAPVVVERNQGGALVPMAVHGENPNVKVHTVWAGPGKATRAEPVMIRYQNGRVRHWGYHHELETQMITFDPENMKKSPDRVDALVWGVIALMINPPKGLHPRKIRAKSASAARLPNQRGTGLVR